MGIPSLAFSEFRFAICPAENSNSPAENWTVYTRSCRAAAESHDVTCLTCQVTLVDISSEIKDAAAYKLSPDLDWTWMSRQR
jgi:hypothetical protein